MRYFMPNRQEGVFCILFVVIFKVQGHGCTLKLFCFVLVSSHILAEILKKHLAYVSYLLEVCAFLSNASFYFQNKQPGTNVISLFYGRNLQLFIISQSGPGRPFQSNLMLVYKATSLTQSGASGRCFTPVDSSLACKHQTRLQSPTRNFRLLPTIANYGRKKFNKLGSS